MAEDEIHKGDIGTIIELTIKDGTIIVDISGATTKQIFFRKPDETTVLTKTGTLTTDGTDGKVRYTTISGDLDEVGVWQVQAHVITPAGEWRSDIKDMSVHDNLA